MAERSLRPDRAARLAAGLLARGRRQPGWVSVEPVDPDASGTALVLDGFPGLGQMPLAGALGLVVLACWGVVLVSRGLPRRVVAWLGLVAALGLRGDLAAGLVTLADSVVETLEAGGAAGGLGHRLDGLVLGRWAVGAGVAWRPRRSPRSGCPAGRHGQPVRRTPGRGAEAGATRQRDGAPDGVADGVAHGAGEAGPGTDPDPAALWKALDEGRDPTQDPTQDRAP